MKSLADIKDRIQKWQNWRSEDFGHDCQALLEAESEALGEACDDLTKLINVVEKQKATLEFFEKCGLFSGNRAREVLAETEKILGGM